MPALCPNSQWYYHFKGTTYGCDADQSLLIQTTLTLASTDTLSNKQQQHIHILSLRPGLLG